MGLCVMGLVFEGGGALWRNTACEPRSGMIAVGTIGRVLLGVFFNPPGKAERTLCILSFLIY